MPLRFDCERTRSDFVDILGAEGRARLWRGVRRMFLLLRMKAAFIAHRQNYFDLAACLNIPHCVVRIRQREQARLANHRHCQDVIPSVFSCTTGTGRAYVTVRLPYCVFTSRSMTSRPLPPTRAAPTVRIAARQGWRKPPLTIRLSIAKSIAAQNHFLWIFSEHYAKATV